jgi:GntR family transcriptional regulator
VNVPDFVCDPSENVYEQVADHIAARIAAGLLPPGSMLPNERALAAEYGVAVGTARKAAELLERRGLIKIKRSKGKFVLTQSERSE